MHLAGKLISPKESALVTKDQKKYMYVIYYKEMHLSVSFWRNNN